jgi:hypothetical protein
MILGFAALVPSLVVAAISDEEAKVPLIQPLPAAALSHVPVTSPPLVSAGKAEQPTDLIEDAVDKALMETVKRRGTLDYNDGVVQSIADSVKEDLADKLPLLKRRDKASFPYGDEVPPVVGLFPATSPEYLQHLRKKEVIAEKTRAALEVEVKQTAAAPDESANCEDCLQHLAHEKAKKLLPEATEAEKQASQKLHEAEAWAALETRRLQELPGLVESLQEQANMEHKKRLEAESGALQAKIERIVIQKIEAARSREVQKARHKLMLKKEAANEVAKMRAVVEKRTQEALEETSLLMFNRTRTLIREVVRQAVAEAQQEAKVEHLRQRVNLLSKEARDSAARAEQTKIAATRNKRDADKAMKRLDGVERKMAEYVGSSESFNDNSLKASQESRQLKQSELCG